MQCNSPVSRQHKKSRMSSAVLALSASALLSVNSLSAQELEEIIVTAKKREQSLQDVSISITALDSQDLENAGIQTTVDLTQVVPGLNVTRQLGTAAPILRGVGNYNTSPGFEGAVALYVDDIYISSAHAGVFSLANLDRVEVLRGPQGTLFGRNATGGLIHVVTKTPSTEATGSASISYANNDAVEGKLYATGGLTENVAADIAVYFRDQGDGFGTNLATGNDVLYRDEIAARAKVLFDFGTSQLVLSADYSDSESDIGLGRRHLPGSVNILGMPAPADFFDINQAEDPKADNEQWGVSAKYTHQFDSFEVVALASHRELDTVFNLDQGSAPIPFVSALGMVDGESTSAELRFQSTGDGRLQWTVGGYYYGAEDKANPLAIGGAGIIGATAMAPGGPFAAFERNGAIDTTSLAVFGEAVWSLDDRSDLAVGGRYTSEEKDFDQLTILTAGPGSPLGAGTLAPAPAFSDSETFKEPSWRVTIDRKLGNEANHLVYFTAGHGFKSGVYNAFDNGPQDPVEPETLDSYEIGFKSEFADNRVRLNGAAFYYEYDDLQLTTQVAGVNIVRNVGKAEIKGIELELLFAVTDSLEFNMSASFLDGEFKSFPVAEITTPNPTLAFCPGPAAPTPNCSSLGDVSGNELPRAPDMELSAGVNYNRTTALGDLSLALNVYHNDGSVQDFANRISVDSYTLVNAGATLAFGANNQYSVHVFGRNLGDEEYASYMTATAFGDEAAPAEGREYGVRFGYDW